MASEPDEPPAPAIAVAVAEPEPAAEPEPPMAEAAAAHAIVADAAASHAQESAIATHALTEAAAAGAIAAYEERLEQCRLDLSALDARLTEELGASRAELEGTRLALEEALSSIRSQQAPPPEPLTSPPSAPGGETPTSESGTGTATSSQEPPALERKKAHRWI